MSSLVGLSLAGVAGGCWGLLFFSWGLPLTIPARSAPTALLAVALAAASPAGRLAASAFLIGMGASSGLLVATFWSSDGWWIVPTAALVTGSALAVFEAVRVRRQPALDGRSG